MLHLSSAVNRATEVVGREGTRSAEHEANEQPEREQLRQPDAGGVDRAGGVVNDLHLPGGRGLADPCSLVRDAQLIRNLSRVLDAFAESRLPRVLLEAPRPPGPQVVDRRDAPVE